MLLSELCKIIVNKVSFRGFREVIAPIAPPPWIRLMETMIPCTECAQYIKRFGCTLFAVAYDIL